MTIMKRRRGRPPGTGIDDSGLLSQLREMLDRDPSLKPTTAIRALGYENESIIRRLRDKLRAELEQAQPAPQAAKVSKGTSWPRPATGTEHAQVQLLGNARDPIKTQEVRKPKRRARKKAIDQTSADGTPERVATSEPRALPTSMDLPLQAFGAALATANFFAIQNALWWQASLRQSPWAPLLAAQAQKCPFCGKPR